MGNGGSDFRWLVGYTVELGAEGERQQAFRLVAPNHFCVVAVAAVSQG
jgi:hypothetical protein